MKFGEMDNRERLLEGIRKSRWAKVVSVLASITVFCTTYAMVLPAITMSNQDALCGWVEHEHDDTCYNDEGEVICGLEPHVHTLQCYSDMEADIENHDIWDMENPDLTGDRNADVVNVAASLIGYRESDRNYLVSDGQTRGYTRFGHWYGDMEDEVIREAFDDVVRDIITEIGTDLAEDTTGGAAQRFYSEIDAYNAAREAGTLYAEANEVSDEGMYASANATASDADNDADIDEAVGADGVADADSAQNADKAANADTAQDAGLAVGADFAQGAEFAANADSAQGAEFAASADSAQGAEFAADADSARDAGFAANADSAQTADAAAVTDFAQSAEFAANEAPAQDAEVGPAADSAQNAEDTADGTPDTDSQDGNYTISIEAALALLEEAAANIGSAADSQEEFIAPEAINIQPADEGAAADAQAANEGVAASAQVADEDAEASAQAANEAAAADVQTANKDAEASAQAANKDAAADAHAANESLAANASADANFTPDEASYRMKLLAIATLIEDGRDQGGRISPVSEPSDILLGIDQYLSGDITPDCAAEVVHFIAYLRLYDIADRLPAKIAEKRVGMLPADIVEGHSQKLSNGIPAASYDDWNAMFVSYVLNFAQVYDMGAEVDAGNWAGALAMSGRYADAADYIPEPGDLVFFTPQDGSDTRVGIVSQVNKALFGLGSVKSISVILGDEDNEVQEIRVAIGDAEEGDVVFQALQGYGIVTPRDPEEVVERDNSRMDSIVDFFTGLVSPGAPQDENVSDEAAEEHPEDGRLEDGLAEDEFAEDDANAGELAAEPDSANSGKASEEPDPADTANIGSITDNAGHMIGKTEEDLEEPQAADANAEDGGKKASNADVKDNGKEVSDADTKNDGKSVSDADAKNGNKEASDADVKNGKGASDVGAESGKKEEKTADGKSKEDAKATDTAEEKTAGSQSVSGSSADNKDNGNQTGFAGTLEGTQGAEGTEAESVEAAEVGEEQKSAADLAEDGTPSVTMIGSEFTEDGTALIMNWNIAAQLPEGTLPTGAVLRIDTATGKLHTMTVAQAKDWAGNVRIGGREVTFADTDAYALTFIGGNGLLYSWEDVEAMRDDSTVTFTGIHVKVLSDDTSITSGSGETSESAPADEIVSETEQEALVGESLDGANQEALVSESLGEANQAELAGEPLGENDQEASVQGSLSGTNQEILVDEAISASNSLLEITYQTTAFLKDANNGHNYYVTKASVDGKTATGSFIFENGNAVTMDQNLILRDANLDETGHAAKEPLDGENGTTGEGKSGKGTSGNGNTGANGSDSTGASGSQTSDFVASDWPKTLTADGPDYAVTMTYGPYAGIPDVAKLKVTEIKEGTPEYDSYLADARAALGMEEDEPIDLLGRFFDIKIITKQGEFEPDVPVTVNIEYRKPLEAEDPTYVSAVHFDEEGAKRIAANATEADGETKGVEFEAESFSVYGIVYTVDYSYDGYAYYMAEGSRIALNTVASKLGIVGKAAADRNGSNEQAADGIQENQSSASTGYSYSDFLSDIADIKSSKETVKLKKDDDWIISTSDDFTSSVITITMKTGMRYLISLAKTGENDILTAMAGGYAITVDLGKSLPEGSYRIEARQTSATKTQIRAIESALLERLENGIIKTADVSDASMLDISIIDLDTEKEVEPAGAVRVTIEKAGEDLPDVVHFKDDGTTEVLKTEENTFVTESFSSFTGSYTVDFHYSEVDFSIIGEGAILLSDLFKALEMDTQIGDVADVSFSDPSLLDVVAIKEDTTLGAYLEKYYKDYYEAYFEELLEANAADIDNDGGEEQFADDFAVAENEDGQSSDASDTFAFPDEMMEKEVRSGEWLLVSLKSFTTEETLTVTMKDGSTVSIGVTDPMPGFMGYYSIIDNSSNVDASVSSSVTGKEQERNASFAVNVHFDISPSGLRNLKNTFGFPTLTYDMSSLVQDSPIKAIKNTKPATWYAGSTPIGQYWFQDNVAYLQVTNLGWLKRQTEFGGDFSFRVTTDENELGTEDSWDYSFPGDSTTIHINYKPLVWNSNKTTNYGYGNNVETELLKDGNDYYIEYTATYDVPTKLSSLTFTDTLTGGQTIMPGSISVTQNYGEVKPNHIKTQLNAALNNVSDGATSFSFTLTGNNDPATGQPKAEIEKGTYIVKYRAKVPDASVESETAQKNTAQWSANGKDKTGPNETIITPKKPVPTPVPMKVEKTATNVGNNNPWQPGDTIYYEVVFGNTGSAFNGDGKDVRITDTMTNIQKLDGDITMTFYPDGGNEFTVKMPSAANAYSGDGGVLPQNQPYSVSTTELFNYNIPNSVTDTSNNSHDLSSFKGRIKVNYSTKVITEDEAKAAGIYNLTASTNRAEADGTSDYTENKVKFPDAPEQTKTITKDGTPVTDGSTLEPGATYTYTLTFGSSGVSLKGDTIKDEMNALGDITSGPTIIKKNGNDTASIDIPKSYSYGSGNYSADMVPVFEYTFPDDSVTGVITIEYQVTIADAATLKTLGIYGETAMNNKFTANGKEKSTYNKVPGNKAISVTKKAVAKNEAGQTVYGSNWAPGDTVEYTVTFGDEETLLDGVTLTDIMTDDQTLLNSISDVMIKFGNDSAVAINSTEAANKGTLSNAYSDDLKYSKNSVKVFDYTVKKNSNTYGPIVVTYTTKILDGDTAHQNGLYEHVAVSNTGKTDKGGEGSTNGSVDYGKKPPVPHSKTVSPEDTNTSGVFAEETTVDPSGWHAKGAPDLAGDADSTVLTYTTTFGDNKTSLKGVWMNDSMTQQQKLYGDSLTLTVGEGENAATNTYSIAQGASTEYQDIQDKAGNIIGTIQIKWLESHNSSYNVVSSNSAQVYNLEFNENAGTGPVTITYQTQVIDQATATANSIFGVQNIDNVFQTPEGNDSTHGTVPYEKDTVPEKKMSVKRGSNIIGEVSTENGGTAKLTLSESVQDYKKGLKPGDTLTFELTYGKSKQYMGGKTIYDKMKNFATVIGSDGGFVRYKYWNADHTQESDWQHMPVGDNEWMASGYVWGSTHTDGVFNDNTVTVFNYNLPDDNEIYGPITVEYVARVLTKNDGTVLTADEISAQNLQYKYNFQNTFSVDYKTATTEADLDLSPEKHLSTISKTGYVNPDGTPAFKDENGEYPEDAYPTANNDDRTVTWYMKVEAQEGSSYPLSNVTIKDTESRYMINNWQYNGDMVSERWINYKKAVVTGQETGVVYTPGADYTVTQALTGNTKEVNGETRELGGPIVFYFETITEPLIIEMKSELPNVLIGNYELSNRVEVHDDGQKHGDDYADIKGENTDLIVIKRGVFDESNKCITWTVVMNPNKAKLDSIGDPVEFTDILPEGLRITKYNDIGNTEANPSIMVEYGGDGAWGSKEFDVTTTGNVIDTIDIRQHYGDPNSRIGNLSGTKYTVVYQTVFTDEEWARLTSTATCSDTYSNTVMFSDGGSNTYTATEDLDVEITEFIEKFDVSDVAYDDDGKPYLVADDVTYKIEVNPHKYMMNNGEDMSLYDTIPTSMDIRTGSYMESYMNGDAIDERIMPLIAVYNMSKGNPASTNLDYDKLDFDVSISYNDDSRQLMFENLKDQTNYVIIFKCRVRSLTAGNEPETFSNTATLVGGGTFSDNVSEKHVVYTHSANAYGAMSLVKVDENDVTTVLEGAEFKLFEVNTSDINWIKWNAGWPTQQDSNGKAYHVENGKKYYQVKGPDGEVYAGDENGNKYVDEENPGGRILGETQITYSSQTEDGIFRSDADGIVNFGHDFNHEGNSASFKFNTLYYWMETKSPDGYTATTQEKHYFVLYDESDDETAALNKRWAWDLDDRWTASNEDVICASLSNLSTWTASNSKYRSINVQKVWSGDSQNGYDTRPASVTMTLMQKSADGTVTEYHAAGTKNPINMSGDDSDYWPSVTWTRLPVSDENGMPYTYFVKEDSVPGYSTKYSDNQEGVESGRITVTNTLLPSTTKVGVQKKWEDQDAADRPANIKVTLKQIPVDSDGVAGQMQKPIDPTKPVYALKSGSQKQYIEKSLEESATGLTLIGYKNVVEEEDIYETNYTPTGTGEDASHVIGRRNVVKQKGIYVSSGVTLTDDDLNKSEIIGYKPLSVTDTVYLMPGNSWAYEWTSLPTKNRNGETYLYTIVEDTESKLYNGETKSLTDLGYTASYSDNNLGVIGDTVNITNTRSGEMKLKKAVTVNGQTGTRTEADGTYVFVIRNKGTNEVVKTVTLKFENGVITATNDGTIDSDGNVVLTGLAPGTYTVHENTAYNGTELLGSNDQEVIVTIGQQDGGQSGGSSAAGAMVKFTNNIDTTKVSVSKAWINQSNAWPTAEGSAVGSIEVTLKQPDGNGGTKTAERPADYPDGQEWTPVVTLTSEHPTYDWTGIDPEIAYTVEETKINYNVTDYVPGTPDYAQHVPFSSVAGVPDGHGRAVISNYEVMDLPVTKAWSPAEANPASGENFKAWSVEVQLLRSEKLISQAGKPVNETSWSDYADAEASDIPTSPSGTTITLTNENTEGAFEDLPKYRVDGNKVYAIRYKVEEAGLIVAGQASYDFVSSVGATTSGQSDENGTPEGGYTITNTKRVSVPVEKIWNNGVTYKWSDAAGKWVTQDGKFDIMMDIASVEFTLKIYDGESSAVAKYSNGSDVAPLVIENPNNLSKHYKDETVQNPVANTPTNKWKSAFTDLPELQGGQQYVIEETKVTFKDGTVLTQNTTPSIATVFGTESEGTRSIPYTTENETVTSGGSSETVAYKAATNAWQTTSVPVNKVWADGVENPENYRVFVTVYRKENGKNVPVETDINGNELVNPIVLASAATNITIPASLDAHTRENGKQTQSYTTKANFRDEFGSVGENAVLPKYQTINGTVKEVQYVVVETAVYDNSTPAADVTKQFVSSVSGTTITNSKYVGPTTGVTVNKKWTIDGVEVTDSAKLASMPSQTFKLYRTTSPLPGSSASTSTTTQTETPSPTNSGNQITVAGILSGLTIYPGSTISITTDTTSPASGYNIIYKTDESASYIYLNHVNGNQTYTYNVPQNISYLGMGLWKDEVEILSLENYSDVTISVFDSGENNQNGNQNQGGETNTGITVGVSGILSGKTIHRGDTITFTNVDTVDGGYHVYVFENGQETNHNNYSNYQAHYSLNYGSSGSYTVGQNVYNLYVASFHYNQWGDEISSPDDIIDIVVSCPHSNSSSGNQEETETRYFTQEEAEALGSGKEYVRDIIVSAPDWTYSAENLSKYAYEDQEHPENNIPYYYFVVEQGTDGGTTYSAVNLDNDYTTGASSTNPTWTITNNQTEIEVKKQWVDASGAAISNWPEYGPSGSKTSAVIGYLVYQDTYVNGVLVEEGTKPCEKSGQNSGDLPLLTSSNYSTGSGKIILPSGGTYPATRTDEDLGIVSGKTYNCTYKYRVVEALDDALETDPEKRAGTHVGGNGEGAIGISAMKAELDNSGVYTIKNQLTSVQVTKNWSISSGDVNDYKSTMTLYRRVSREKKRDITVKAKFKWYYHGEVTQLSSEELSNFSFNEYDGLYFTVNSSLQDNNLVDITKDATGQNGWITSNTYDYETTVTGVSSNDLLYPSAGASYRETAKEYIDDYPGYRYGCTQTHIESVSVTPTSWNVNGDELDVEVKVVLKPIKVTIRVPLEVTDGAKQLISNSGGGSTDTGVWLAVYDHNNFNWGNSIGGTNIYDFNNGVYTVTDLDSNKPYCILYNVWSNQNGLRDKLEFDWKGGVPKDSTHRNGTDNTDMALTGSSELLYEYPLSIKVKPVTFTVTPKWENGNLVTSNDGLTDETLSFNIVYHNGTQEVVAQTVYFGGSSGNWAAQQVSLPAYDAFGNEISYYIQGVDATPGGTGGKISKGTRDENSYSVSLSNYSGNLNYILYPNSTSGETFEITFEPIWKDSDGNEINIDTLTLSQKQILNTISVKFNLYRGNNNASTDVLVGEVHAPLNNDWSETVSATVTKGVQVSEWYFEKYPYNITWFNTRDHYVVLTGDNLVDSIRSPSSQATVDFDSNPRTLKYEITLKASALNSSAFIMVRPWFLNRNLLTAMPLLGLSDGKDPLSFMLPESLRSGNGFIALTGGGSGVGPISYEYVQPTQSGQKLLVQSDTALPADAEKVPMPIGSETDPYSQEIIGNNSWTWNNLPATDSDGNPYEYYVVETDAEGTSGYNRVVAVYNSSQVSGADKPNKNSAQALDTNNNGILDVEVSNTPKNDNTSGSISVSKKVEGANVSDGKTYNIQLMDAKGDYVSLRASGSETESSTGPFEIEDGQTITFTGLPPGKYTVVELENGREISGYALSSDSVTSVSGTIGENGGSVSLTGNDGLINKYVKETAFKKVWKSASNSTISWPKDNGEDIPVYVTIKRQNGESGTAETFAVYKLTSKEATLVTENAPTGVTLPNTAPDYSKLTATVTNGICTVTGLPGDEQTGGSWTNYIYTVEEAPVYGYNSQAPRTANGVTTFTNMAKSTYEATKEWVLDGEANAASASKSATFVLGRKLVVSGVSPERYPVDDTFTSTTSVTLDGTADTEPTGDSAYGYEDTEPGGAWHATWKNLDSAGTYNGQMTEYQGKTYRYEYFVKETGFVYNGTSYEVPSSGDGATATYATTNGTNNHNFVVYYSQDGKTVTNEYNKKGFEVKKAWKGTDNSNRQWPSSIDSIRLTLQRSLKVITPIYDAGAMLTDTAFNRGYAAESAAANPSIIEPRAPSGETPYSGTANIKLSESDGDALNAAFTVTGNANDGYTISVSDLPKNGVLTSDGKTYYGEWVYTVTETPVSGFADPEYQVPGAAENTFVSSTSASNGGVVTNKEQTITVRAYKGWQNEDGNGIASADVPNSAAVMLRLFKVGEDSTTHEPTYTQATYSDGSTLVSDVKLNGRPETSDSMKIADGNSLKAYEASEWRAEWDDLPGTDASGKAITYVIRELAYGIENDVLDVSGSSASGASGNSAKDAFPGFMVDYGQTLTGENTYTANTYTKAGTTVKNRKRTAELAVTKAWTNFDRSNTPPENAEVTFTLYSKLDVQAVLDGITGDDAEAKKAQAIADIVSAEGIKPAGQTAQQSDIDWRPYEAENMNGISTEVKVKLNGKADVVKLAENEQVPPDNLDAIYAALDAANVNIDTASDEDINRALTAASIPTDVNGDGSVDTNDVALLRNWKHRELVGTAGNSATAYEVAVNAESSYDYEKYGWKAEFTNLPTYKYITVTDKDEAGKITATRSYEVPIQYQVREDEDGQWSNYVVKYATSGATEYGDNGETITNVQETGKLKITKAVTLDSNTLDKVDDDTFKQHAAKTYFVTVFAEINGKTQYVVKTSTDPVTYDLTDSVPTVNNRLSITTGSDGKGTLEISGIPVAHYIVREDTAANGVKIAGYNFSTSTSTTAGGVTLAKGSGENASYEGEVDLSNNYGEPKTNLELHKVDDNGQPLDGAMFKLKRTDVNPITEQSLLTRTYTDSTGTERKGYVRFGNLRAGSYELTEETAPGGYQRITETIKFELVKQEVPANSGEYKLVLMKEGGGDAYPTDAEFPTGVLFKGANADESAFDFQIKNKGYTDFEFTKEWLGVGGDAAGAVTWPTYTDGQNHVVPKEITVTLTGSWSYSEGGSVTTVNVPTPYIYTLKGTETGSGEGHAVVADSGDHGTLAKLIETTGNLYRYKISGLPSVGTTTVRVNGTEKTYTGEITYKLTEAQVDGYNVPKYFASDGEGGWSGDGVYAAADTSLSEDGKVQNALTLVELPSTGGSGTGFRYLMGLMLLAVGAAGLLLYRRRNIV